MATHPQRSRETLDSLDLLFLDLAVTHGGETVQKAASSGRCKEVSSSLDIVRQYPERRVKFRLTESGFLIAQGSRDSGKHALRTHFQIRWNLLTFESSPKLHMLAFAASYGFETERERHPLQLPIGSATTSVYSEPLGLGQIYETALYRAPGLHVVTGVDIKVVHQPGDD